MWGFCLLSDNMFKTELFKLYCSDFNLAFRWSFLFLFCTEAHSKEENNAHGKLQLFCLVARCVGIFLFLITSDMKIGHFYSHSPSLDLFFLILFFFATLFRIFSLVLILFKAPILCKISAFSFNHGTVFMYLVCIAVLCSASCDNLNCSDFFRLFVSVT